MAAPPETARGATAGRVRSLVVAPQWIGDAVMSEPLLRRLAARGERITVGALPWVAPAYRAMEAVDEVLEWPFQHGRLDLGLRWRLGRGLAGRFVRAYVLPNSMKAALLPAFAGIALRIGYTGEGRAALLNRRRPAPPGRPAMVGFYAALAEVAPPAGTSAPGADVRTPDGAARSPADPAREPHAADAPDPSERPRLRVHAAEVQALRQRLGLAQTPYRLFAPGAEYGPAKCWPASHYADLARRLIERDGLPVLLLGSRREAADCAAIVAALPEALRPLCRSLAGETSLADAIALISAAHSLVSNDSGLMHVAAAFGIEQVALFGSTSPLHTPPLNPRARVLWLRDELDLPCMPCFERVCRYGHTRCLVDLPPDRVAQALPAVERAPGVPAR